MVIKLVKSQMASTAILNFGQMVFDHVIHCLVAVCTTSQNLILIHQFFAKIVALFLQYKNAAVRHFFNYYDVT